MSADSAEVLEWITYGAENLQVAELALDAGLLNPCLQNVQQSVEKSLKAARLIRGLGLKRTHSIRELNADLLAVGVDVALTREECELLDSIYVGSKYPGQSVLPNAPPDALTCRRSLELARRIIASVQRMADVK